MRQLAIAMDLGSSGIRAQALDALSGEILSTAITSRHPLPGCNVMDHLHFALEVGGEFAQAIMIRALNRITGALGIDAGEVVRLALCGNPVQLSIFQGSEIRDLAYAGSRKLAALGVSPQLREARVASARDFPALGLPGCCEVVIPPAVRHEVGADAIAMIIKSGMLRSEETSLAVDFGTNAELALCHGGRIYTGSTAAGPALEGQQISCGMLAVPGVVAGLQSSSRLHRLMLLDSCMRPVCGPLVDLQRPGLVSGEGRPIGITGTGMLAAITEALEVGAIKLPHITTPDRRVHLGELYLTERDVAEAGKAIGALRAGHIALCREAGIAPDEIGTAYMSGASGTYMDPLKAQRLGMIPPRVQRVFQIGNSSLAMARDLALDLERLGEMSRLANTLRRSHCRFASCATFQKVFILELAFWTEGMPLSRYREFLQRYGLPDLPEAAQVPELVSSVASDIDLGGGELSTISQIGRVDKQAIAGCIACLECVRQCPGTALGLAAQTEPVTLALDESLCHGVSCRRCERVCPVQVFRLEPFFRLGES